MATVGNGRRRTAIRWHPSGIDPNMEGTGAAIYKLPSAEVHAERSSTATTTPALSRAALYNLRLVVAESASRTEAVGSSGSSSTPGC